MVVSAPTYTELAVTEAGHRLELHDGVLVEKPPMTVGHNRTQRKLGGFFYQQLDLSCYEISINASRVYLPDDTYYIPDLAIVPVAAVEALGEHRDVLEVYAEPLPLVVEVWSPSTGDYDIEGKIPRYQERGDAEIWFIHPFERTITVWQLQTDGSYHQSLHTSGTLEPITLPEIEIEIAALFD